MKYVLFTLPNTNNLSAVYQFLMEQCSSQFKLMFFEIGHIEMQGNDLLCERNNYTSVIFIRGLCSAFSVMNGYYE